MQLIIMETRHKVIVTFAVLIILVASLYYFTDYISRVTGFIAGEDERVVLAQCLQGKNAELYISSTCPECSSQLEIFGIAEKFINKINCNEKPELCQELNALPAWQINNSFYYGVKSLDELKELTGC